MKVNLEDVESYLDRAVEELLDDKKRGLIKSWLMARFVEIRAREIAKKQESVIEMAGLKPRESGTPEGLRQRIEKLGGIPYGKMFLTDLEGVLTELEKTIEEIKKLDYKAGEYNINFILSKKHVLKLLDSEEGNK